MTGGDLAFHLSNERRFNTTRARFYAAQILLGIEHLHSLDIIYRDLKPQNILISDDGNCAITDLGLSTKFRASLTGCCGTRGYWAPEMLTKKNGKSITYGKMVDWWSYGCIIYEMLYGKCPFRTPMAKSLLIDDIEVMLYTYYWVRLNSDKI